MVVGSMVHEMLQLVLQKNLRKAEDINFTARELLDSKETAYELYANLMTRDELEFELQKFIPNVISFVEQYIKGNPPNVVRTCKHKNVFGANNVCYLNLTAY